MKLSKRVNYKRVTKKSKNGKKSNRVKNSKHSRQSRHSKKRQNRKINKKTQKGGQLEAFLCDTQYMVDKELLNFRTPSDNTGFFYVSSDLPLSTRSNSKGNSVTLKAGLVVELEDGMLVTSQGLEDKKFPLLNEEKELPRSLIPVEEPKYSVRCGAAKAQNETKKHENLSLEALATFISKSITELIDKLEREKNKQIDDDEMLLFAYNEIMKELNKYTGLSSIKLLEAEMAGIMRPKDGDITRLNKLLQQAREEVQKLSKEQSQEETQEQSENTLTALMLAVLKRETYNNPSVSLNNINRVKRVKDLVKRLNTGSSQKGSGLKRKNLQRIGMLVSASSLILLGPIGGTIVAGILLSAGVYFYNKRIRKKQQALRMVPAIQENKKIGLWICRNLNLSEMLPQIRKSRLEELKEFDFTNYSNSFIELIEFIVKLMEYFSIKHAFENIYKASSKIILGEPYKANGETYNFNKLKKIHNFKNFKNIEGICKRFTDYITSYLKRDFSPNEINTIKISSFLEEHILPYIYEALFHVRFMLDTDISGADDALKDKLRIIKALLKEFKCELAEKDGKIVHLIYCDFDYHMQALAVRDLVTNCELQVSVDGENIDIYLDDGTSNKIERCASEQRPKKSNMILRFLSYYFQEQQNPIYKSNGKSALEFLLFGLSESDEYTQECINEILDSQQDLLNSLY